MNPATDPMMTPYTLAARCASATGRLLPSPQGMLRSLTLVLALAGMLPQARAVIPQDAKDDPRYDKGYLVVTYYSGVPPVGSETDSTRTTRTNKINEALRDAYNNNLALYFPAGTYQVNDTLRAYTAHQNPSGSTFAVPRTAIAVIGSTLGVPPTIRLVPATGDTRFNSGSTPRPVIAFKNFDSLPALHADGGADDPASGYFAMLRGININCGGKAAAIGLYFNQAQNSSIENVSIDATNAHTGILGLPARGWGVVNIEVIGGQYGIDTNGTNNAGSVLAGVTLTDQTVAAFRHDGFVPVTLVGFKIVFSPPNSNASAITLHPKTTLNSSGINLIDGSIQMNTNPAVAVINNEAEMNFYLRNVYFKTGNADHTSRLIKSSTKNTVTASVTVANPWARIGEYSYCTAATDKVPGFDDTTPPPASASVPLPRRSYVQIHPNAETNGTDNGKETMSTPTIVKTPLNNLVTKHKWDSLPSADDSDAFNVMTQGGITPGKEGDTVVVNSRTLQDIIDRYSAPNPKKKIFLPKGIYRLTGPINLRSNTTLFGAARNLTRIEVAPSWSAQLVNTPAKRVETPIITTDPSGTATTYLGDLTIGVDVSSLSVDWFTALHWRAGGDSMVHMGQPYRLPEDGRFDPTNPHSLLKITETGGGRWYFTGAIKSGNAKNSAYRILEVFGTTEPLWFYGLNLEHALGCSTFGSFTNAKNIRIYTVKSEFDGSGKNDMREESSLLRFINADNVALFGAGAIRNASVGHGVFEFLPNSAGDNCDNVLVTLIAPQNNKYGAPWTDDKGTPTPDDDEVVPRLDDQNGLGLSNRTLKQTVDLNGAVAGGTTTSGATYPHVVALYKNGTIDDSVMKHITTNY